MFEKSLQDVIQGLRKSRDEEEFLKACLKDCREEIISTDMDIKAQALSKLIYVTSPFQSAQASRKVANVGM